LKSDNVTVLGYVSANYGNRELSKVLLDVDTYFNWQKYGLGIDGVFVDEVDFEGRMFSFFEAVSRSVSTRIWSQRNGTAM
jgi:hypothetical protein